MSTVVVIGGTGGPTVTFYDKPNGKTGSWNSNSGRSFTETVGIDLSDDTVGPKAIITASGFHVGDTYRYPLTTTATETDTHLFIQSLSVSNYSNDGCSCEMAVEFSPIDPSKDDRGPIDPSTGIRNPFNAPAKVRWGSEDEEFAVTHDKNAVPILNKAGDPFDPPLTIPIPTAVITASLNQHYFDQTWITTYKGRVNNATWLGWPTGCVLCKDIRSDCDWNIDVNGWVWSVEYDFAIRSPIVVSSTNIYPGFAALVMNAGLRQKTAAGNRSPIIVQGAPVSTPWPLDSSGVMYAENSTTAPIYLPFDIYPQADFSVLGMPSDLFSRGTP
jgi:hypothetical protein